MLSRFVTSGVVLEERQAKCLSNVRYTIRCSLRSRVRPWGLLYVPRGLGM